MGFFWRYFAPHAGGEPGGGFRRPARFPLSLPVFVLPVGVELSVFLLHRDTLRTPCCASPLFSRVPVIALLTVKSGNARDCGVVGCGVHPWTTLRLRWHGVNAFPDTGVLRCPTPCGKGGRGRALAPRGGTPFSWGFRWSESPELGRRGRRLFRFPKAAVFWPPAPDAPARLERSFCSLGFVVGFFLLWPLVCLAALPLPSCSAPLRSPPAQISF